MKLSMEGRERERERERERKKRQRAYIDKNEEIHIKMKKCIAKCMNWVETKV